MGCGWHGVLLLLICLCCCYAGLHAQAVGREKRQAQFSCNSDETEVMTPYLYIPTATKDCASLLSEIVDYYDLTYRQTCQYWKGGALPDVIEDAYISFCVDLTNGTTKYRTKICCPGATTEMRCFTCADVTPTYDTYLSVNTLQCDHYGSGVQTCSAGQVCMTDVAYPQKGYGYGQFTKRCEDKARCEAKNDPDKCKSFVTDPACTYCCDTPYCNYQSSIRRLYNGIRCPCLWGGTCIEDSSSSSGYRCACRTGFNGTRCEITGCSSRPCQNNGYCWPQYATPYYLCGCRAGYRGYNCEIKADLCSVNTCQNGGTCYDHLGNGTRCVCTEDYVGSDCSVPVPMKCPVAEHVFNSGGNYISRSTDTCTQRGEYVQTYYNNSFTSSCRSQMPRLYGRTNYFKEGVNGNVPATHGARLYVCEKGDTTLFYKLSYCCAACHSNPCQNGGWCQQNEKGPFTCKCRYGYNGVYCQHKEAICYAVGDPHYKSFDRRGFHFQSPCKYVMARTTADSTLEPFEVLIKHENRHGSTAVAYIKYLEINFGDNTVKIDKGKIVTVNGASSASGGKYNGFHLLANGRFLRLETNFGLVVEYDGNWLGVVKVPDTYTGNVEGLCGNFDRNSDNDLVTSEGVDVQNEENAHTVFGNSWHVDDPDEPTCQNADGDPPKCTAAQQVVVDRQCGIITDVNGPLGKCAEDPAATASQFFSFCVYDVCANQDGDPGSVLCKAIEAFAAACKDLGHAADWRTKAGCGLDCPAHSTYFAKTTACQATCSNPNGASECPLPDTENCVCDEGYVMEGDKCIEPDQCGCLDSNYLRHRIGSEWLSDDCSTLYKCQVCGSCTPPYQIISTDTDGCSDAQKCQLENGTYKCVSTGCKEGSVTYDVGSVWQTSCTVQKNCTANGIVTKELPDCKSNERCTIVGTNHYTCEPESCIDAGKHHKIGDMWLSSGCDMKHVCNKDGKISSKAHSCPSGHECKKQGELYLCVKTTCKDEKGGIRQVGAQWMSRDCSNIVKCTNGGLVTAPAGCKSYEKCQAGDLAKCVPLPSAWTAWSGWGACSGRCGTGSQTRFRTCQPPDRVCPGSSSESRSCQCDYKFNIEDCDDVGINNDLGYLPDVCNCRSYIQCEKTGGTWKAHHRMCAPCTEWDQDAVTCVHVNYPCNDDDTQGQQTYCTTAASNRQYRPHATDDKKYDWEVMSGTWVTMTCALGTYFSMKDCGCIHDPDYTIPVRGPRLISCFNFDLTYIGTKNVWAEGIRTELRPGLMGQAVYFSGQDRVEIPYFTNRIDFRQFSVSLWFRNTGYQTNLQGILSNGLCDDTASVKITAVTDSTVSASIETEAGNAMVTDLKAAWNQWHHLVLVYNGKRLMVYVNNKPFSTLQTVGGRLLQRHCPMVLGTGKGGLGFTGYMDKVCFYNAALDASDVFKLYDEGKQAMGI